jgi:hypothetical protein
VTESWARTPLLDLFRRGEVPREVRLLAARGAVAPRAHEQLALLVLLHDDADAEVRALARSTIDALPEMPLQAFLARSDVPADLRNFFADRGVAAADTPSTNDAPLIEDETDPLADAVLEAGEAPQEGEDTGPRRQPITMLPITERVKLAMRGTREQRTVLIRDPNRLVAAAVLSSPKLSDTEVEGFARMANVSDEVLRTIGATRTWTRNYAVVSALTRNPKTPPAVSMPLVNRLNERDLKLLSVDRNVPEGVRLTARKLVLIGQSRRGG